MAGVTADERGQLLLISAIGLSVLLVALAVVLNTALYTGSLAARDTEIGEGRSVQRLQHSVAENVAAIFRRVNEDSDTSHAALAANFSSDVASWSALLDRMYVTSGATVTVSVANTRNGTRIVQHNASRNFTNASAAANWTVAESVTGIRDVRMNVTGEELADIGGGRCTPSDKCYRMEIENGSADWRLFVYASDNGSDISIEVVNASGASATCTTSAAPVWINVTAGTVAGSECSALAFGDGDLPSGPVDVTFHNGDRIAGSYSLVVDRELASEPDFDPDGSPSLRPVLYSANVQFWYRSADISYRTAVRVPGGDEDA